MITETIKKLRHVLWLIPGFLLWASFPPMGEHTDCFFALAPLLWVARRRTARTSFWRWFSNGLLFWFATLAWMPAIVKNGGPWPLVALGWGALSAYCALYFAAFGWLSARYWTWVRGGPPGTDSGFARGYGWRLAGLLVVEPVLWAGLEIVRSRLMGGFSWNQLGIAPVNGGFGAPAVLGGVYLVSALVVLVNGTVASIVERVFDPERGRMRWVRSVETFVPLALVYVAFVASGTVEIAPAPADGKNPQRLRVALLQRNFPCVFERETRRENPVAEYWRLMEVVRHAKPSLVVLPESALCEFGELDAYDSRVFANRTMQSFEVPALIAGGSRSENGQLFNSAALYSYRGPWLVSPSGDGRVSPEMQIYDKVHLVPFGEFIPGDKQIPALQKLAPVGSCTPGELKTLSLDDGTKVGVAICYEDTDSAQIRRLAEMGAEVLVFITNDNWFSKSEEAVQHSWHAVARALETGLPVVRVGNSGVTGTVGGDGKAAWLRGADGRPLVDAAAAMCDEVRPGCLYGYGTPYVRFGDKPLFIAFLAVLAAMSAPALLRLRRRGQRLEMRPRNPQNPAVSEDEAADMLVQHAIKKEFGQSYGLTVKGKPPKDHQDVVAHANGVDFVRSLIDKD